MGVQDLDLRTRAHQVVPIPEKIVWHLPDVGSRLIEELR